MVGLGAGLFLLVAMISLQLGAIVMGPFGRSVAASCYGLAGLCGYPLIALGMVAAIRLLLVREPALPILVIATIRSDLLGEILKAEGFTVAHEVFTLGPLPSERLASVMRF